MKYRILTTILILLFLSGCIARLAYPEKDGRKYLEKHGVQEEIIYDLINKMSIDNKLLLELYSKYHDSNVRFLVLANPGLKKTDQILLYKKTRNDFARSGLATNRAIDEEVIFLLMRDPSHTVYCKLGQNDTLSEEQLRKLRSDTNLDLRFIIYNINCPADYVQEYVGSGDEFTLQSIEITKQKKR